MKDVQTEAQKVFFELPKITCIKSGKAGIAIVSNGVLNPNAINRPLYRLVLKKKNNYFTSYMY